jgi:hypothetical protein
VFEIAAVFYFPFVVAKDQGVYLYSPDPDCGLWGEWDLTTFYLSAYIFGSPHVCFTLFVNQDYLPCPYLIGVCTGVCVVQSFK